MSLRKKACIACVTSKRRCDQLLPACSRCTKQHRACQYPLLPVASVPYSHAGPALPYDDTPISDSIIDNFTWDNSWDILGPESNLTLIPGATLRQISPLGIGGLESFVETGAHDSTQFEQFRPAINEDFRPRSTSILDQYRPAVSSRHVTTTLDNFRQFLSRPTDIQWTFCASIMVSYIGTFAKTASTDFIAPYKLQSPLAAALGVCAAHETLTGPGRLVLSKLIEAGIDNLICYVPRETALSATNVPTLCDLDNCLTLEDDLRFFRRELARVQAMTLYHIIACFGGDAKQKSQAAQHEPLLAAWKISLQEQMHKLYRKMDWNIQNLSISDFSALPRPEVSAWERTNGQASQPRYCSVDSAPIRDDELESAHRTILISYFVRATYAVVTYGVCPLVSELESLMVSAPASLRRRNYLGIQERYLSQASSLWPPQRCDNPMLSYKELLNLWEQGYMSSSDLEDGFTRLLLVACKGISVLSLNT
ncbi:uncharacterized protein TRIVIDRAFT_70978 [Trichoderma virens Gv29-8]|uniref:Zn(2)-C6 fungal-type domain-containing protein n=1 Tax=Hypocrea virens (strain Gv29-8 / FGSC 10586) TaxID=413071 RepID=G9MU50_HYPVG|nr:uncharacterized protein TRIVIDRAFT_70978 [Trichoderma virens Gv29-8]EHK22025.1 hypothetical protein TRIVIDRAFT_70978 [Trichoderma virens Gv29-8]